MRRDGTTARQRADKGRGRPLAWHLWLLCASVLVPVLALEAFLLFAIAAGERSRHEAVARDAARRIAVSLDRGLATLGAMAEVLATSDHLLDDDLEAFRLRLRQLPQLSETGIALRDAAGLILLSEGGMRAGERDPVAEAAARATGRPRFSGLLHDAPDGTPGFAVIVRVPDIGAGPPGRILGLRVPAAELDRLLAREDVPDGMTATITDGTGIVLARSRDGPRLVGRRPGQALPPEAMEGWRRGTDADGQAIVAAHARSEIAGWTAWVFMPEHAFTAPLRQSLAATLVLAGLFAGFATILAVTFARRIALPIAALAEAVKAGDESMPATPVREVNDLADAYAATRTEAQRLRDAQAELRRIARLNEMGALAAALAHEINQPLTAAANFSAGALRLMPDAPGDPRLAAARDAMRDAADQAVQAGRIVGRLRSFLAASDGERVPTDLNALVEEAVRLALADARDRGVTLRLALAAGLPSLTLDRVQIGQVVVNLIRNAVEAMEGTERKELIVSTRLRGPGTAEVAITDTGQGVSAEMRATLFSPFVTSKPHGMGVGLAISRGIVEDHGGHLDWAPNPGGGAVFRITLPAGSHATQTTEAGRHAAPL